MDFESIKGLSSSHGTSFYIFHPERFIRNLQALQDALAQEYPNTQLAYALKANYMPVLCNLLNTHGYWGEVVSGMEYEIARMSLPGNKLIFNGPCKSKEEIRRAIREGATINLDSFPELEILEEISKEFDRIQIGLRVSFEIGMPLSRFGFNFENGDFSRALRRLGMMSNVTLISLHSHFTTKERSLTLFEKRVTGMAKVMETVPEPESIRFLNVGGGFFGPISDKAKKRLPAPPPSFDEYGSVIGGLMKNLFGKGGPTLVVEPGVSMIADAMDYVVKVLNEKVAEKQSILTVDGSINCLFPTGGHYEPDYTEYCSGNLHERRSQVVGYTCMEHDVLLSEVQSKATVGDFFTFHNRGGYSNVYKPPFIKEAPAIVGLDGTVYASRQTTQQVLAPYLSGRNS